MIQALADAVKIWDNPFEMLDEWAHSPQKARHERLIADWVADGGKVVELGCGNGRLSLVLNYNTYIGYDQSLAMVQAARDYNPFITVALIDIFSFSPDERYDTLLLIDVAIHQTQPVEAIATVVGNWYAERYLVTLLVGMEHEDLLNSTVVGLNEMSQLLELSDCHINRIYSERLHPDKFNWVLIELVR